MIDINSNPSAEVIHPEKKALVFLKINAITEVFYVRGNRCFVRILFEKIPEEAFFDSDVKTRHTLERLIQRRFQYFGVNIFFQFNADPENIGPCIGILTGKNFGSVVKLKPIEAVAFHILSLSEYQKIKLIFYYTTKMQ